MAVMCPLTEDCRKNQPSAPCIHEWMMMVVVAAVVIYFVGKVQGWF